ncbi:hypothetical protein [Bacillus sp. AFS053548]|uniref:hypothetical protein n=1 Tax=Bacillus sp. AFS053548 TaxID=2033505 RepID=UPI000BFDC973|nr:hypothetical protein [Bacillus sp. AFS053548]PGM54194.1 hypothetical protein CN946_16465 [Bacillus sp. AFS053548]
MTALEEVPITILLAQLIYSPLYIFTVILALGILTFLKSEKGCLMLVGRVWAVIHLIIYILAIYFYFTNPN